MSLVFGVEPIPELLEVELLLELGGTGDSTLARGGKYLSRIASTQVEALNIAVGKTQLRAFKRLRSSDGAVATTSRLSRANRRASTDVVTSAARV
jgi:hypothetical protein